MNAAPARKLRMVIAGGAGGIGRGITELLTDRGHDPVVIDRVEPHGLPAYVRADLTDPASTEAAFAEIGESGPIQGLVTAFGLNAVQGQDNSVHLLELAAWRRLMSVNLDAVFHTLHYAMPYLVMGAPASVVTVGSVAALIGSPGGVPVHAYSASKGAVVALSRAAAVTYAPMGVRVNCICPSTIDTPVVRETHADRLHELADSQPLGRLATIADVAHVTSFLLEPASSFVTGAVIPVDGGLTAR